MWALPQGGHFKINIDGVFFMKQKAVGVRVVIKDSEGRLVVALSKKIPAPIGQLRPLQWACSLPRRLAYVMLF